MAKKKQLRKRQLLVIDDLFGGELDEEAVLDKHGVKRSVYNRWLGDESFAREFSVRMNSARFQGKLLISRYCSLAAARLIGLTESENQETARKACLDIIKLGKGEVEKREEVCEKKQKGREIKTEQLSAETASRLLEVLAEKSEQ